MPNRTVNVRLTATNSDYNRALLASAAVTRQFSREGRLADLTLADIGNTAGGSTRQLDRFSGRLKLLLDIAAALGPALVPIGAIGIPAIMGVASALGFTAIGAGTAIVAFKGVGDALKALNKAHLEPTEANLKAADLAMKQLGPDARQLARYLADLDDEWKRLRNASASGIAPGLMEALDALLTRGPQVRRILREISDSVGDMLAEGGESLASERWDDFFDFIEREAPDALTALGHSLGSLTHGVAELWKTFDPLNDDVLGWLEDATRRFDEWAGHLSETEGFADFVAFIEQSGPEVGQLLGSIAMALIGIAEAAAPVGAATLPVLEQLAKIVAALAESDLGTPLLAALTLTRTVALLGRTIQTGPVVQVRTLTADLKTMASTSVVAWGRSASETLAYEAAVARTRGTLVRFGRTAGLIGGLTLATSGLTDQMGLTNTVMGASMGLMAGGWGAAVGGAVGLVLDLADAHKRANDEAEALAATLDQSTGQATEQTYVMVAKALAEWRDEAEAAGIAFEDLVGATIEGGAALDDLKHKLGLANVAYSDYTQTGLDGAAANAQAQGALGRALDEQHNKLLQGKQAIDDKTAAEQAGADASEKYGDAADHAAGSTDKYTDALTRLSDALEGVNNLLTGRKELRAWEKSWLDLNAAVEKNGQNWDKTTSKGIDNLEALDATVDTTIDRVDTLREHGRNLAAQKFIDKQISELEAFAAKNPQARAEVQKLIDKLKEVNDTQVSPRILIKNAEALRHISQVGVALSGLDDKTIYITTIYRAIHQENRLEGQGAGGSGGGHAGGTGKPSKRSVDVGAPFLTAGMTPRTDAAGGFSPSQGYYSKYDAQRSSGGRSGGGGKKPEVEVAFEDWTARVRDLFRALDLSLEDGRKAIRDELEQLKRDLKEAGGLWTDAMRDQAARIVELAKKYDRQVRLLEAQQHALDLYRDSLDDLRSAQSQFAEQVKSQFTHDLFGNGLAGVFLQAGADTNDATMFTQVLAQLAAMGLDGAAYQALATSGDLATAQELLATRAIDAFENAINSRLSALNALGVQVGNQAYGAQVAATELALRQQTTLVGHTQETVAKLQASVDRLEKDLAKLANMGEDVRKGTQAGARQGVKEGLAGTGGRR